MMNISTPFMDETFKYIYNEVFEYYVPEYFKDIGYTPWIFSLLGSALIGLSGILPLFVIPIETGDKNSEFNRKLIYLIFVLLFFILTTSLLLRYGFSTVTNNSDLFVILNICKNVYCFMQSFLI